MTVYGLISKQDTQMLIGTSRRDNDHFEHGDPENVAPWICNTREYAESERQMIYFDKFSLPQFKKGSLEIVEFELTEKST